MASNPETSIPITRTLCRNGRLEKCLALAEQLEARDLVMVRRVHMNETASQCRLLVIMIASGCPLQSRAAGQ